TSSVAQVCERRPAVPARPTIADARRMSFPPRTSCRVDCRVPRAALSNRLQALVARTAARCGIRRPLHDVGKSRWQAQVTLSTPSVSVDSQRTPSMQMSTVQASPSSQTNGSAGLQNGGSVVVDDEVLVELEDDVEVLLLELVDVLDVVD